MPRREFCWSFQKRHNLTKKFWISKLQVIFQGFIVGLEIWVSQRLIMKFYEEYCLLKYWVPRGKFCWSNRLKFKKGENWLKMLNVEIASNILWIYSWSIDPTFSETPHEIWWRIFSFLILSFWGKVLLLKSAQLKKRRKVTKKILNTQIAGDILAIHSGARDLVCSKTLYEILWRIFSSLILSF